MTAYLVLAIGVMAVASGIWIGWKNWTVRSWPTTTGTVIQRGVGPTDRAVATGPPAFRFEAKVTYRYEVNGQVFEGHTISPNTRASSEEDALKRAQAVPDRVMVHYNPEDPSEAYLRTDSWLWPILATVFGMLASLGAVVWLLARTTCG